MNAENCELAQAFVSRSYVEQGSQALAKRQKLIKALLSQRRLPPTGWDDATIQMFLQARTRVAHAPRSLTRLDCGALGRGLQPWEV
jgi:hypothetical protein